jgi:hypothetical protein
MAHRSSTSSRCSTALATGRNAPTPDKKMPRAGKPATVDEYLSRLTAERRTALDALRAIIRAAAPDAEEGISYDVPTYRVNGRMLVSIAAAAAAAGDRAEIDRDRRR